MNCSFSQYTGIHNVKNKSERVWPCPSWSILIPKGFSYIMDDSLVATGGMGKYLLQVQETGSADFRNGYASEFNVVLYGNGYLLERKSDNAADPELLNAWKNLPSHLLGSFQQFKCSKDMCSSVALWYYTG